MLVAHYLPGRLCWFQPRGGWQDLHGHFVLGLISLGNEVFHLPQKKKRKGHYRRLIMNECERTSGTRGNSIINQVPYVNSRTFLRFKGGIMLPTVLTIFCKVVLPLSVNATFVDCI